MVCADAVHNEAIMSGGCCVPGPRDTSVAPAPPGGSGARDVPETAVEVPGGSFLMGTDSAEGYGTDGEGPARRVEVGPYLIDTVAVTNARFAEFVAATSYVTETERIGWSFVFVGFLPAALRRTSPRPQQTPWWAGVTGATWSAPEGPGSIVGDRADHPVVHLSHADARAYAAWVGGRLPSEAEWEYAARGGLEGARYPWGDELTPAGEHRCNIWQGDFPVRNTAEDGYRATAPVTAFAPNGYGLHNTAGNVWEWCADHFGPRSGDARVMRGGSYLCHESYCNRYRVAARTANTPDSAAGHLGLRVAWDVACPAEGAPGS
ncbi:Sulfatase modifying factor 1 precursor (C-alpha-formyglycine- generating enzyme 1) [Pseudonocardia sp. Ae168_Ps1]|nr:Sulfatase modifying factor 1 precursor (C-alpha-formyglycine- generating enzyme 1) [Pseudonocardia sp. Ae150A_Ps1]OLL77985.1 Sulfatase modifying factor 1 precursor (C-alpha-formyglycine- generating enzyme 1) [Pseudonocardia sp. Ae168_Ps1]OLL87891.1 Sulfatase modifying factor 1 precursor (C-alpha-formyglycine- generating enzyme 1) [Pseudonocardia sp. Ae263_Ps1]OLL92084.1 Sulfatase modifying factor 1 precursor (C-alpha-formyglycine- generating enzyme 1) [Pseudonocardia sp. Ae356_Ps1]